MKNSMLLFLVMHILYNLNAMEPSENPKSKPVKITKVYSASLLLGAEATSSHEYFEKMNRETVTKLRNRFCQLRYAISYPYSPLMMLGEQRAIERTLKENELLDEIDRFAFYRKKLFQTYSWPQGSNPPSEIFFNMEEGVLPEELAVKMQAIEIEANKLTSRQIKFLQEEEEKLKKECAKIFVQKKIFEPKTKFHLITNIYGDIKGLIKVLEQWEKDGVINNDLKILNNNAIFCLGNCGDEGIYSIEAWYTILCLANANPDKFFLIRGSHEHIMENATWLYDEAKIKFDVIEEKAKKKQKGDSLIQETLVRNAYNILRENPTLLEESSFSLEEGSSSDRSPIIKNTSQIILERMNSLYRLLPVGIAIGIKNMNKNHIDYIWVSRALELGFDPTKLLANESLQMCQWIPYLNRSKQIEKLPQNLKEEITTIATDGRHANMAKELSCQEDVPVTDIKNNKLKDTFNNIGFCHDTFQDDEKAKIGYDEKFRIWKWSKELTQAVLNLWSNNNKSWYRSLIMWLNYPLRSLFGWGFNRSTYTVAAHVGAYQGTHGTCPLLMRKIIKNKGIYQLWDQTQKANEDIILSPGSSVTLLGFPDNQHGYLSKSARNGKMVRNKLGGYSWFSPFNFATIATLTFNSAMQKWKMSRQNVKVFDTADKKFLGIRQQDDVIGIEAMD